MAEQQKLKIPNKKSAFIVLIITLVIAFAFYSSFYSISSSEEDLTKAIEKYTGDNNVTLLATEEEDRHLIALYTTEKPHYKGMVLFKRGWNGLWAPVEYNKATDISITTLWGPFATYYRHVITGANCDPRIVSYEYVCDYLDAVHYEYDETGKAFPVHSYGGNTSAYSGNVTESNFIHIYKDDRIGSHSAGLKIYDSAGNNIEPELTEEMKESGIEKERSMKITETGKIHFVTQLILLVGFTVAWNLMIPRNKKK
jgi:hypothetical protein